MEEDKFRGKYRVASTRFKDWDYTSKGLYFITFCTKDRVEYFGAVETACHAVSNQIRLSPAGQVVLEEIYETERVRANIVIDSFVVMPNHVHLIIWINETVNHETDTHETACHAVSTSRLLPNSIGSIVGQMKIVMSKRIRTHIPEFAWQPRFHDRIIRDEDELHRLRQYIANNPKKWLEDKENVDSIFM